MITTFAKDLLAWFDEAGRKNLPWQKNISPYRVWISEIMLQQTQVATVIPYYEKFMAVFPTISALATVPIDTVLHYWTGLGYYARARNIHKTAQIITTDFRGKFPSDLQSIMSLPGIGRSTAGAILSIAFKKAAPILDGNVKRVLTRFHAISGYPGLKEVESKLWQIANGYTPRERCAEYTQAIMDLGATICTRTRPLCSFCPLIASCKAYKLGEIKNYPASKPKTKLPIRTTQFLIIENLNGEVLLEKRPMSGLWGGLWGFPEYREENVHDYCERKFHCKILSQHDGDLFRHTFSHYHLDISPIYLKVRTKPTVSEDGRAWCLPSNLPKIGLSAPVKKLLISHQEE